MDTCKAWGYIFADALDVTFKPRGQDVIIRNIDLTLPAFQRLARSFGFNRQAGIGWHECLDSDLGEYYASNKHGIGIMYDIDKRYIYIVDSG